MKDTPNHDDMLSLDSVIDDLLAQSAPVATDPGVPPVDPGALNETAPFDVTPVGTEAEQSVEQGASPTESAPFDEELATALDELLVQANDLQASVAQVAPPLESPVPPPPSAGSEPVGAPAIGEQAHVPAPIAPIEEAPAVSAPPQTPSASAGSADASTLQSLDAELAALTDDLLAGEVESGVIEAPAPDLVAATKAAGVSHAVASVSPPVSPESAAVTKPARTNKLPSIKIGKTLGPLALRVARPLLEVLRTVLGLAAAPLAGKRTLQQSLGWLASYTLFLAAGLWIYLLVFHTPPGPVASTTPSYLRGGDPHGAEGSHDAGSGHDSGDGASHDTHDNPDGHGAAPEGHGQDAHGGGDPAAHGEKPDAHDPGGHEPAASGSGGHGAPAKGAHGAPARNLTVVNGYAMSTAAAAKAGAKAGAAKDAHGAKKDDGHGAAKGASGAKKSGGH